MGIVKLLANLPASTLVIAFLILLLIGSFFAIFVGQSVVILLRLRKVTKALARLTNPDKQALKRIFADDAAFSHLWTKYSETLHREQEAGNAGQGAGVLRATVPASVVFTADSMVDARIGTEFFKHVPGIFTGLGIIGTFSGLIRGLQHFDATANADAVRTSLAGLMENVGDAFVVSAIAIGAAMLTTAIERLFVTVLYKRVEDVTTALDGFFVTGVGEDYLASLTRASERSAADSANLKDALVGELKEILTNLTNQQIEAQSKSVAQVGAELAKGVSEALSQPLAALTATAERGRADNGDAVTRLLTDVLAGFSQKLEELFGGQIGGINRMQQQTIDSLGAATEKLTGLVAGIQQASERSNDALNERLLSALNSMETHQKDANERMAAFADRMRESADQSQSEAGRKLQETLSQIGLAVEAQLAALREQAERSGAAAAEREVAQATKTSEWLTSVDARSQEAVAALQTLADRSAEAHEQREQRLSETMAAAVEKLAGVVGAMTQEARSVAAGVSSAVEAMRGATTTAIDRMNEGSQTLHDAASEFANAGNAMAGAFQQAEGLSLGLRQSAGSVEEASMALRGVVADHAATRQAIADMIAQMNGVVENARREASATSDLVAKIEAASQGLAHAELQAEQYLNGVTAVLTRVHETFNVQLTNALQGQYRDYLGNFTKVSGLLSQAVENLKEALQPDVERQDA